MNQGKQDVRESAFERLYRTETKSSQGKRLLTRESKNTNEKDVPRAVIIGSSTSKKSIHVPKYRRTQRQKSNRKVTTV